MDNKYFSLKHRFVLGAAVSFFLTFSLTLFGPLSLYISGSDDLWFSFKSILLPVCLIFTASMIVMTLLCSLPKSAIHKGLCCLVFGIALGFYLQGNFFNIKYGSGVLDGSQIVWEDYTTYGAIDSAMWAACIALPFAFVMVFKKQWRNILINVSLALVLVQCITLATMVIQNRDVLNKVTYEVTTEGMYDLSSEKNTIVFILDAFDQKYYDEVKENHPEYIEKLDGFTEYTNALASGARTIEAFPSMMTGTPYKKETKYATYIENIWDEDTAFDALKENGVDSRVFAETIYFGSGATECIDNIVDHTDQVGSYTALTKTMYQYTMYSYMPHYLKMPFWLDTAAFQAFQSENAYSAGDVKFYNNYKDNGGFSYKDDYQKAVRVYSLEGAHTPYTMTKDVERSDTETSLYEQIDGCFTYLFEMFDDMKENGVFDKSTIIVTADHGDIDLVQHPILLIKKANAKRGSGYKTSEAPVSHFDLPATLVSTLTGADYSSYGSGKSYFDIKEGESRTRTFYLNTGSNKDARVEEYRVKGSAYDDKSMELMDCYYTNGGVQEKYKLGTLLTFTMDATANVYCTEGFRQTTGWRTPMAGPKGQMVIPIDSIPKDAEDLHVYFGVQNIDLETTCTIEANGRQIFKGELESSMEDEGLNLLVPTKIMPNNNVLTLDFYFDGVDESEMDLDVNERTMTISFNSFKIYTQ